MNVLIIEDEKPAARRLSRMLGDLQIPVHTMLHSVSESVTWFNQNTHPDLIFLDIQLSDGLSFEIFDQIDIKSSIIFTTAYDEYALKAFKLNSIDYLLKPIDDEELEAAVLKFKTQTKEKKQIQVDFDEIKRLLVHPADQNYKKRFTVKIGQHIRIVPIDEVVCFFSENKATYMHTKENRSYPIETTLDGLENEIDPNKFFRINRKFYVKMEAIQNIVAYTNSRLQLKLHHYSDEQIIVARDRVKSFKQWLE